MSFYALLAISKLWKGNGQFIQRKYLEKFKNKVGTSLALSSGTFCNDKVILYLYCPIG
jgi:hypothetical protein